MKSRVEGLVTDVAASSDDGGETWNQSFFLSPWRDVGGEIHSDVLRISIALGTRTHTPGRRLKGKVVAGKVADLRLERTKSFTCWAATSRNLPIVISRRRLPLPNESKPSKVRDAVLGTFTIEPAQLSAWRDSRTHHYELLVLASATAKHAKLLLRARTVVARVEKSLAKLRARVATRLLATCNQWRATPNERPVTRAAFSRKLKLASITVGARSTSLVFECGKVLGDHGVEVRLTSKGKVSAISIA